MESMMKIRNWMYSALAALSAAVGVVTACVDQSDKSIPEDKKNPAVQSSSDAAGRVTPVRGPSWIKHLGIQDIRDTAFGQEGGSEPPLYSQRSEPTLTTGETSPQGGMGMGMGMRGMMGRIFSNYRSNQNEVTRLMNDKFLLYGSDLYRLNCQSCHGPKGRGKPPEINSLIGPVQGTSQAFIEQRAKKMGHPIGAEMAHELAEEANATLRDRLDNGGKKMPPFRFLNEGERSALIADLLMLAGASGGNTQHRVVTESVAHAGEDLVKGTCHICHDATGPGSGHMAMMQGIIPSLASFPEEKAMPDVVRQVELGSMPMMSMMGGPSMPAFPYITEDEAAAGYLYLVKYPPEP
jgi:mono/diheme cytochrome c family protein